MTALPSGGRDRAPLGPWPSPGEIHQVQGLAARRPGAHIAKEKFEISHPYIWAALARERQHTLPAEAEVDRLARQAQAIKVIWHTAMWP